MTSAIKLDCLDSGEIPIHRHHQAYAAVVLSGSYYEQSIDGMVHAHTNTIVYHPPWHLHKNTVVHSGAVCNISLPNSAIDEWRTVFFDDVDSLLSSTPRKVFDEIVDAYSANTSVGTIEPPRCISELSMNEKFQFSNLEFLVTREHAHRTFKKYYGMTPGQYRRERQLQTSLRLLSSNLSLAEIATASGFSDQSHMSRIAKSELGLPPSKIRRNITRVQDFEAC